MANPYEQAAREAKVTRLVDALDAHLGRLATRADLTMLAETPVTMAQILRSAKVDAASQVTVNALVARIEAREAQHV